MREKKNNNHRIILEIISAILAPILVTVVSYYIIKLPPSDIAVFCILSFLALLGIHQAFQLKEIRTRIDGVISLIKLSIDALSHVEEKVLQLPKGKRVVTEDLVSIFASPLHKFFQGTSKAFVEIVLKPSSPEEHEEIKRLIEKANRGEITREEAERLKVLLENEKRKRENTGDVLGAIFIGLLLLFILGLFASFFLSEER
jgi:hypothetical protein